MIFPYIFTPLFCISAIFSFFYFNLLIIKLQMNEKRKNMFKYIKRFWKDNLLVGFILFGSASTQTIASVLNAAAFNALIVFDFREFIIAALQMFLAYMFFLLFTYFQVVKTNDTIQKMVTS